MAGEAQLELDAHSCVQDLDAAQALALFGCTSCATGFCVKVTGMVRARPKVTIIATVTRGLSDGYADGAGTSSVLVEQTWLLEADSEQERDKLGQALSQAILECARINDNYDLTTHNPEQQEQENETGTASAASQMPLKRTRRLSWAVACPSNNKSAVVAAKPAATLRAVQSQPGNRAVV